MNETEMKEMPPNGASTNIKASCNTKCDKLFFARHTYRSAVDYVSRKFKNAHNACRLANFIPRGSKIVGLWAVRI